MSETKPIVDDLLLQEVYSLREKLKLLVHALKYHVPEFDINDYLHRLGAVDFDQMMEEINEEYENEQKNMQY